MEYAGVTKRYQVVRICTIGIKRHIKIKAAANPYLPEYAGYFWELRHRKGSKQLAAITARELRAMGCRTRLTQSGLPLRCLSGVMGNYHAPFLGEWGRKAPDLPAPPNILKKLISKITREIFFKIPIYKSLYIARNIEHLEKSGRLEDARELRQKWLKKLPIKYSGALWCSEGEDLLHEKQNYSEALIAFEKAMQTKFTPDLNPLRIYSGASVATVMNANLEKAKEYYAEARNWHSTLKKGNNLNNYLSSFDETFTWLKYNIHNNKHMANKSVGDDCQH